MANKKIERPLTVVTNNMFETKYGKHESMQGVLVSFPYEYLPLEEKKRLAKTSFDKKEHIIVAVHNGHTYCARAFDKQCFDTISTWEEGYEQSIRIVAQIGGAWRRGVERSRGKGGDDSSDGGEGRALPEHPDPVGGSSEDTQRIVDAYKNKVLYRGRSDGLGKIERSAAPYRIVIVERDVNGFCASVIDGNNAEHLGIFDSIKNIPNIMSESFVMSTSLKGFEIADIMIENRYRYKGYNKSEVLVKRNSFADARMYLGLSEDTPNSMAVALYILSSFED